MKNRWKVGIVKHTSVSMFGLHGHHFAFDGLPGVEKVALVDENSENVNAKLENIGAKRHYSSEEEMYQKEDLDIVVLTSRNPNDHLKQIRLAAKYGVNIYCEKPMSADLIEADEIVEIVEKANIKLCMGHPSRYDIGILAMKEMIESGEIGTPLTIHSRGKCDHRGGGEDLMTLGTHVLDIQIFLFGNPEYVIGDVKTNGKPITETDTKETTEPVGLAAGDDIHACFSFSNGVRGIFESRRGLYEPPQHNVLMGTTVVGTEGALSLRFYDGNIGVTPLRISKSKTSIEYGSDFHDAEIREFREIPGAEPIDFSIKEKGNIVKADWFIKANRYAAWDLMCAIQDNRLPISNVYTARTTLEMIYGIYKSAVSRKAVNWSLKERTHPLKKVLNK